MGYKEPRFKPTVASRANLILRGQMGCPDNMKITKTCRNGHGYNGKTVRYVISGHCIFCEANRNSKIKHEEHGDSKAVAIDHLRDDLEMMKLESAGALYDY